MVAVNFTVVAAQVGAVDFGTIDYDIVHLAKVLSKYVHFGSKRFQLSVDDLEVFPPVSDPVGRGVDETDPKNSALECLLRGGTRFLDAIFYLSLPEADRPAQKAHPLPTKKGGNAPQTATYSTFNNHAKIGKCMFLYFFYIMIRARPPGGADDATQPIPNFIKNVLGINMTPPAAAEYIASFPLANIDHRWVQHVGLAGIGQEAMNRLGLGVAGYRLATPFKLIDPDNDIPEHLEGAFAVAKSFATTRACWGFHPTTRSPDVLGKYGNINKNLTNLILEIYNETEIQEMLNAKILAVKPVKQTGHTNYKLWTAQDRYIPGSHIFSDP